MAVPISEAQAELISSLSPDDIPIKLRCAICSKLAVDAFRLPCCEQAICSTCQADLPSSCPVCEHSPLSAEDCNPNKSLRTTIRVFLRTAEKKREASRPKQPLAVGPVEANRPTNVQSEPDSAQASSQPAVEGKATAVAPEAGPQRQLEPQPLQVDDQERVSHSKEESLRQDHSGSAAPEPLDHPDNAGEAQGDGGVAEDENEGDDDDGDDPDDTYQGTYGSGPVQDGYSRNAMFSGAGDFNQMHMMMAMQNGMGSNGYGSFPMMGMPGMSMDPMAMQQSMYMNGGFQGMGMNGIGGGFGGGFGHGPNNNVWNGSQSWSFDQNNYNQNGAGMGSGDFGNFNSGFQAGYNQGNFGQFNDYRRNNYGRGRGRGRGRGFYNGYGRGFYGGYGRGAYQQDGMANYQGQGQGQEQSQGQGQLPLHGIQASAEHQQQQTTIVGNADDSEAADHPIQTVSDGDDQDGAGSQMATAQQEQEEAASKDNPGRSSGQGPVQSGVVSAPDVPINAPTGPKAMRQGLPNTSLRTLRALGYQVGDETPHEAARAGSKPPTGPAADEDSRMDVPEREQELSVTPDDREPLRDHDGPDGHVRDAAAQARSRTRSPSRSRDSTRSQSRSRSRSRSPGRSHKTSQRRRRQRSESTIDDDRDNSYRRTTKHRNRRHFNDGSDEDRTKLTTDSRHVDRSRSASPPPRSRRHGHRSHRDADDRSKSQIHRFRRDREHDDRRRRDRRDRSRRRDHDRARDKRHGSPASGGSTPTDPHTKEREARNRERLLKEAQRMAGLVGSRKRARDDDDDDPSSRMGRRTSRRSDAYGDEERMRRLEAEREGGRWE